MVSTIRNKSVHDVFINISHFLDHFIMLIFAKAAYDAGRHFGLTYEQIISYGTLGLVLFGACAPVAARLADKYSRSLMMVVYHFIFQFHQALRRAVPFLDNHHLRGLHPHQCMVGWGLHHHHCQIL